MSRHTKRQRAVSAHAVVGIDAGKRHHAMVVRPRDGRDSEPFMFASSRNGFERALGEIRKHSGDADPETVLVGIEFAGNYGFTLAHFLAAEGHQIVSVLPAHTKRWKEIVHNQRLKTDPKDAITITDLVANGHFVGFPFLDPTYADLRYLVSTRERLSKLRIATISRMKSILQVVWPEFEERFPVFGNKTPMAVLRAFPGPEQFLGAPRRRVIRLLRSASRGHLGEETYDELRVAAEGTIALPGAQGVLRAEMPMLMETLELVEDQMERVDDQIATALDETPEAEYLLSIPKLGPVTAGVFLGSIGDPRAYESSRQILKVAGLSLVEHSSGATQGKRRISKRGRPELRRLAFMFAMRSVRASDGMYAEAYRRMLANNGGRKLSALVALGRRGLRLMYSIARNRRLYTPEPPK